jgi:nucleotidyltransferase/DNA polymerase involved in DNA repair
MNRCRPQPQALWTRIEIDQFAAQALLATTPALANVPFAVVRQQQDRHKASLFSVSRCARMCGAEPGMPVFVARRKVGARLQVLPRDAVAEAAVTASLREVYDRWTPELTVEPTSAWLDLSGTPISRAISSDEVGDRLGQELKQASGLQEIAIGVSASRLVAQVLARQIEADGVRVCPFGQEQAQLARLDADSLPGLASNCRQRAHMYGLQRVDQLLELDRATLVRRFGKHEGARIYGLLRGLASAPRQGSGNTIEAETILHTDINDEGLLREAVRLTADRATHELRKSQQVASAVRLQLVYSDSRRTQKTVRLPSSTDSFAQISEISQAAFRELHVRRVALRSLHVAALRTSPESGQRDLFDGAGQQKQRRLGAAITEIRQRMGFDAVVPAGSLALEHD